MWLKQVVDSFDKKGRTVITRTAGKVFQVGMSGCPVLDVRGNVIAILVGEPDNAHGQKVHLESVALPAGELATVTVAEVDSPELETAAERI